MNNTNEQAVTTDQSASAPVDDSSNEAAEATAGEGLTFWQMLGSVLAAAIGVQSKKNRERDFTQGKPIHFIILGICFTAAFVLIMTFIVQLILSNVA